MLNHNYKSLKFGHSKNLPLITLKFGGKNGFTVECKKRNTDVMANSVDPDQTAPSEAEAV